MYQRTQTAAKKISVAHNASHIVAIWLEDQCCWPVGWCLLAPFLKCGFCECTWFFVRRKSEWHRTGFPRQYVLALATRVWVYTICIVFSRACAGQTGIFHPCESHYILGSNGRMYKWWHIHLLCSDGRLRRWDAFICSNFSFYMPNSTRTSHTHYRVLCNTYIDQHLVYVMCLSTYKMRDIPICVLHETRVYHPGKLKFFIWLIFVRRCTAHTSVIYSVVVGSRRLAYGSVCLYGCRTNVCVRMRCIIFAIAARFSPHTRVATHPLFCLAMTHTHAQRKSGWIRIDTLRKGDKMDMFRQSILVYSIYYFVYVEKAGIHMHIELIRWWWLCNATAIGTSLDNITHTWPRFMDNIV